MPTYTFKCEHCEKEQDEVRSIKEYDFPGPLCCNTPTQRIFAAGKAPEVIYQGGGWPSKDIRADERWNQARSRRR